MNLKIFKDLIFSTLISLRSWKNIGLSQVVKKSDGRVVGGTSKSPVPSTEIRHWYKYKYTLPVGCSFFDRMHRNLRTVTMYSLGM